MKTPGIQLLEQSAYRCMPWRNGQGSTLEIAREMASGDEFAWRLSLAEIERDAEFSAYRGYVRALVLVAGKRLLLRYRGHGYCVLDGARRGTRFEGGWRTRCEVPEGRCTDLSLIVRKAPAAEPASLVRAPAVLRLRSTRRLVLPKGLYGALFVLDGSVAITESFGSQVRTVRAHETLLASPGPGRTLTLRRLGRSPAQLVILRWRPARVLGAGRRAPVQPS